jgi:hypothetical protein
MRENRNTPFHYVALQKVQDENESKILNGIDIVNRIWSMGGEKAHFPSLKLFHRCYSIGDLRIR